MVRSFLRNGGKHYGASSSRERHDPVDRQGIRMMPERARTPSDLQYSDPLPGRVLRSNIPRGANFACAVEPRTGHHPQDGREVAEAGDGRGF